MKKLIAMLGSIALLVGLSAAPALATYGGGDNPVCVEVENPDYVAPRTEEILHEAEYETVHHEAVTSTEVEWKWWGYKEHGTKTWTDGSYPSWEPNRWSGDWRLTGNEREVVVSEAWDEQVLVKEAWTEVIEHPGVGEPTIENCPPEQPAPKVTVTTAASGVYICATEPWDGTVYQDIIETTQTINYVWDAEAWQWVLSKPVYTTRVVGQTEPEPHAVLCQPTTTPTPTPTDTPTSTPTVTPTPTPTSTPVGPDDEGTPTPSPTPETPVTIPPGEEPTEVPVATSSPTVAPIVAKPSSSPTEVVYVAEVLASPATLASTGPSDNTSVWLTVGGILLVAGGVLVTAARKRNTV